MSYDISVGEYDFNYTSNMGPLFRDHIEDNGCVGLRALDGKTGAECAYILGKAFKALQRSMRGLHDDETQPTWKDEKEQRKVARSGDKAMRAKYDAENGWGSTLSAVIFLGEVMAACVESPEEIVSVSC